MLRSDGVFACPVGRGRGSAGSGAWRRARPARRGRAAVPPRRAAARDVSVQARPGAGRRLWHAAARRAAALHARIADILERRFAEIAERQPELLARHCAEAGLLEKAARLWGKAGQQSLERSALVEAIEQMSRALALIAALPASTALRREQLRLQVALITPLMHVKGFASPETKAAAEQAGLLIEQAHALGEAPDDPLVPFVALYGIWVPFNTAFDGDMARKLAEQFLSLAEKQDAAAPRLIAHRSWVYPS